MMAFHTVTCHSRKKDESPACIHQATDFPTQCREFFKWGK